MKFKRIKKFGYWGVYELEYQGLNKSGGTEFYIKKNEEGVYNVFGRRGEIDGVIFEAKTLKECKDFCKKAAY